MTVRGVLRLLGEARLLVVAGGLRAVAPLLVIATVITVLYPDGRIRTFGPLVLSPELRVLLVVPLVLSVAIAGAHAGTGTPVVIRNARVAVARAVSYLAVLGLSAAILTLGGFLAVEGGSSGALRTLLLFAACALVAGSSLGPSMAWAPVVILFGLAVTGPPSESDWTLFGLVLREEASVAQLVVTGVVFLAALAVAVGNPRSIGYLRVSDGGRRGPAAAATVVQRPGA